MKRPEEICCEMGRISREILDKSVEEFGDDNFIVFLRYCSERLNKDDSIQAIWRDFQTKVL